MSIKNDLGEAIKARMGVTPGHVVAKQFSLTTSDVSKIRRGDWLGISVEKLLSIAERVGVKLVYTFEDCEPVTPSEAKGKRSGFDINSMNAEVF